MLVNTIKNEKLCKNIKLQRYQTKHKKHPSKNKYTNTKQPKKIKVKIRWFDSVPRAFGFQAVKLTAEEFRRTQPKLST